MLLDLPDRAVPSAADAEEPVTMLFQASAPEAPAADPAHAAALPPAVPPEPAPPAATVPPVPVVPTALAAVPLPAAAAPDPVPAVEPPLPIPPVPVEQAVAPPLPAPSPAPRPTPATRPHRPPAQAAAARASPAVAPSEASMPTITLGHAATSDPIVPPRPVAGMEANAAPAYPEGARRRGEQGRVLLRVSVSADGLPQEVAVLGTSGHPLLDSAAQAAVRHWRFVPATQTGRPVAAVAEVPIRFRLEN